MSKPTFDGRGLQCPLAFVLAKQHLLKNNTKVFLFDDEVSLYNFTNYLTNNHRQFSQSKQQHYFQVSINNERN